MDELVDFLLANIQLEETQATEDPDGFSTLQFFDWARSGNMLRNSRYGDQGAHITAEEALLLQRCHPEVVRAECARRREVVKTCAAALTFSAVSGMEGARVLADRTLRLLAERYADQDGYDEYWRP